MRIGEIDVTPLSDGFFNMPPEYFGETADWGPHKELLGDDGNLRVPIGCFIVRTAAQTVLVDAGLGDLDLGAMGRGGELPAALDAAGVAPADIDLVVCTHLHLDHSGWLVKDGAPFFPNATVRFGAGDWEQFVVQGEVPTCPVQLEEPDWQAMSDVDKDMAARTREALFKELEGTDSVAVAAHFPGLEFGRILPAKGKRYFSVS